MFSMRGTLIGPLGNLLDKRTCCLTALSLRIVS